MKTVLLIAATVLLGGPVIAATEVGDDQYIIFYHNDALGSPLVVTDHNGNTLWHEHSDPYGKARDRVMPTGKEFFNDHRQSRKGYTGHLKDSGSDLVYMKARYYDPVIGRFYSNDPIGFNTANPMMFNRYAYANNNPYRYVDPDGKEGTARSDQIEELGWDDPSAPLANAMSATGDGMVGIGDAIEPTVLDLLIVGAASKAWKLWRKLSDVPKGGGSVGAMARRNYQPAPYHGRVGNSVKSKAPVNGQDALDSSVQVKSTSSRRVGIDYDQKEFAVFDQTSDGIFHGHVRSWSDLTSQMQNSLRNSGMVDRKGNILGGN